MKNGNLLTIKNLILDYRTVRGEIRALNGVSLVVRAGDTVGLIGESGSGKTTVANCIMRLLPENARIVAGGIDFHGRDLLALDEEEMRRIRGKSISLVFQAAMNALNPVMRVGDQIVEAIQAHGGVKKDEARRQAKELFTMVGIDERRLNNYPHEYSGGMKQRAVIAMALSCRPELVIADEPTTALDVIVQAQIMNEILEWQKKLGMTLLYISHDIAVIAGICRRIGVMYAGYLVEYAETAALVAAPRHPYTRGLMDSLPDMDGEKKRLESIPGEVPDLFHLPAGCPFHPRCFRAEAVCRQKFPFARELGEEGRQVACHFPLTEGEK